MNLRIPSPEAQTLALTAYDGMLRNPNTRVRPARLTEAGLAQIEARPGGNDRFPIRLLATES
jgi:hypothetical protein